MILLSWQNTFCSELGLEKTKDSLEILDKEYSKKVTKELIDIWNCKIVEFRAEIRKTENSSKKYFIVDIGEIESFDQEKKNSTIKLFKEAKIRAKPNFSIGLLIYKVDNSIQEFRLFCVIDSIPIAKGCEKNVNKLETQKCFSAYISNHFSQNIDLKKYIKLGAKKKTYRTLIKFKINKNSKISDINIQCDSEIIKQDLYNITKSINIIEPGRHNGIPVIVNYGFPLTFKLE